MSYEALAWVRAVKLDDATARYVLYMLADRADEEDSCYPSVALLVENTSLAERTVRKAIKTLQELCLIEVERQRKADGSLGRNRYRLLLARKSGKTQDVVGGECDKDAPAASGAGRSEPHSPAASGAGGGASGAGGGAPGAGPYKDEAPLEAPLEAPVERERADARTPEGGEVGEPDGSTSGGTTSGERANKRSSLATERVGQDEGPPTGSPVAPDQGSTAPAGPPFASFKRKWPNKAVDDMSRAQVEFDRLSAADQQAALDGIVPYREALKAAGRTKLHAAANYLKQRKWEDVDTVPDPSAPYIPPHVPAFGALWSAAMIEMLRTGAFARKRFAFKQLCEGGANLSLAFGKERDGQLVGAAERFTKAKASSETGRAFIGWLEAQFARARMPHQMPRFRDDFWLYVPPPDIAKAWGMEIGEPNQDTPIERSSVSPERHGPLDDDEVAAAFS